MSDPKNVTIHLGRSSLFPALLTLVQPCVDLDSDGPHPAADRMLMTGTTNENDAMESRPPVLETDRLLLRPLRLDDLDSMCDLLGDRKALVEWGEPLDRDGSLDWIKRNQMRYRERGYGRCAMILRETGDLVGDCGLIPTVVEDQDETELGWIVSRGHWGRGFATEAAVAWRDYALDVLKLTRIVSMVSETNAASRRVAEKLGMHLEREALWGGTPHLMYAITRPR